MAKNRQKGLLAIVIIICVVIIAAAAVWFLTDSEDPQIVSQYADSTSSTYCYAPPAPGEYYCFIEVNAARSEYAGKNAAFLLAFDIFNADGNELSDNEKAAEYQRLIDLGYRLYQTTHIAYMENSEYIEQPIVVGIFTEEELAGFDANSAYGYAFRFVRNMDGSAFSISEDELIASYQTDIAG